MRAANVTVRRVPVNCNGRCESKGKEGFKNMRQTRDWENQHVTQKNRYPMHTPYGAYETVEEALAGDRNASRFVTDLNGDWKFKLYPSPEAAEAFYEESEEKIEDIYSEPTEEDVSVQEDGADEFSDLDDDNDIKVIKQGEKSGLYNALDIGMVWLERALAAE